MIEKNRVCRHCGMDLDDLSDMDLAGEPSGGGASLLAMAAVFLIAFSGAAVWKTESLAVLTDDRLVFAIGLSLVIFAGIAIQTGLGRLIDRIR